MSMVGFATKAGKTESGEFSVERAIKTGRAKLVIIAEDASDNTSQMFQNKCKFYNVPYLIYGTKEQLGSMTGKSIRASVAITDSNFGIAITNKHKEIKENGGSIWQK